MNLIRKIKNYFAHNKKPAEEPKQESKKDHFLGAFFPRKSLNDGSYKDERGLVSEFNRNYFDACAGEVEKIIKEIYGIDRRFNTIHTLEGIDYYLSKNDISVKYTVKGTGRWESARDHYIWSNDIRTFLQIDDPSLTTEKLKKIISKMLEHHLMDYNKHSGQKFGVFYESADKKFINGLALLKTLDIKPSEAMEYVSVMIYGSYKYKKFTEQELEEMFGK